jgi:hypothetical protein
MNGGSGFADALREMMEKKKGDKDTFTMTGQYASSVKYDNETSREYVMYESPNGEQVKVYGNWNEYAVSQDEGGQDMIADEDYPIRKNKDGEFVFDEAKFDEMMEGVERNYPVRPDEARPAQRKEERQEEEGGMEEQRPQEQEARKRLMMMLGGRVNNDYMGGGRMDYRKGGKVFPDLTGDGKITMADILKGRGVK